MAAFFRLIGRNSKNKFHVFNRNQSRSNFTPTSGLNPTSCLTDLTNRGLRGAAVLRRGHTSHTHEGHPVGTVSSSTLQWFTSTPLSLSFINILPRSASPATCGRLLFSPVHRIRHSKHGVHLDPDMLQKLPLLESSIILFRSIKLQLLQLPVGS